MTKTPSQPYRYDDQFLDYTDESSAYSAGVITRLLLESLQLTSVLDIGCARGTWLEAWHEAGVEDCFGVDGDYVEPKTLRIPTTEFRAADLAKPLKLQRTFDLVQSLEVGEHLAKSNSSQFVKNLTSHSKGYVLFSAAVPGQGGEHHINEQPLDYWRQLFTKQNFIAHDYLRPLIADQKKVSYWYRFNTLLYVREDRLDSLPAALASTRVRHTESIADLSPPLFRLRKRLVSALPPNAQTAIAQCKARLLRSGSI